MTDGFTRTAQAQQRVIRVFVSSTFRDMHAERDELIKRVFPQLRKLCEQRGVTFSEVDLRWGITQDEASRGEVLPIVLAEIDRCRPYFIGLFGELYGWIPHEIPQELIEQQPWLTEYFGKSVGELEVAYAALNHPEMADSALFYFRDSSFVNSLPLEEQADYLERAADGREKLAALKDRIRASGLPVRENYPNAQIVGELVLRDLTEIIDRLYPQGSEPDHLDREASDHEAFAQSRARVYIGRQAYYDCLDQNARSDGAPLVVLGEAGSGKSALLSNWALRYRAMHPDELILVHFIGATPQSTDWSAMLRRIIGELSGRFDIQQEIPDEPDALRGSFADWLDLAAAKGKVVLILDALNLLEDRDGALDLLWLPLVIPVNIRLILSTLPGRPLDALMKRGWATIQIAPLEVGERKQLIKDYFAQYAKQLDLLHIEHIANAGQTANPLYLRALLDELRIFGIQELLAARIDQYLATPTMDSLFERILERYELDFERDRHGLIQDAMSLIWAAPPGLAEAELLELLGSERKPLPHAYWSPLALAAEQSLVNRSGLISFSHDYLRQAVEHRYVNGKERQEVPHRRLASMFRQRLFKDSKVINRPSPDIRALKYLAYHAREGYELRTWLEAITDFAYLEAVAAHVDVWYSTNPDGSIVSYHEGYFVVDEELRKGMGLGPTEEEGWELITPLHKTWSKHQEFIELPDAVIPTLYKELSTQDRSEQRRVYDKDQHRFIIVAGPLWTWCERERRKYEKPEYPWEVEESGEALTVFISAKSADYTFAEQIFTFLRSRGVSTFLSQESLPELGNSDYRKEIDRALDGAAHMVVVTSSVKNVMSTWVEAEWGFFINEKRSGRKTGNLITVVVGDLKPSDLPPSLRYYEAMPFHPGQFEKILRYVSG